MGSTGKPEGKNGIVSAHMENRSHWLPGGEFSTETGWRCLKRGNGFCKSKERNERKREKIENSEVVSHSVWLKSRIILERVNRGRGYQRGRLSLIVETFSSQAKDFVFHTKGN